MSSSYHTKKKHLSKQVVLITYTPEKKAFLQLLPSEGCESFLLRYSKKLFAYCGLCESSLDFQSREDQINTAYEK